MDTTNAGTNSGFNMVEFYAIGPDGSMRDIRFCWELVVLDKVNR
jgi:hypothetical protein